MKRLFINLLIIFSIFYTNAEAQVTRPPYFDTCQYLQPLQGEWLHVSGNDTIRIYLRYHRNFYSDPETYNSTIDELWGLVEYKQGNNIIMSDYANRSAILPYNLDDLAPGLRSIVISTGKDGCTNPPIKLEGLLTDIARCEEDKKITATVNPVGTLMTWKLMQPAALLDSTWCSGFTLPQEFTLLKQ